MLPSRANGLPSNPRSRSVGRPQPQASEPVRPARPRSRSRSRAAPSESSHRYARSEVDRYPVPSEPSSRSRPPPSESSSHRYARSEVGGYSRSEVGYARSEAGGASRRSNGSTASSGSSLFDRRGYESSRTSLEDDRPDSRKRAPPLSLRSRDNMRDKRMVQSAPPSPTYDSEPEPEVKSAPSLTGDGYNIWGRVTAAASSLTVSVSKAWTANITTFAGEETPVGAESRLTRAMKAYHAEKATSPTDLPEWLFDENERQPRESTGRYHKPSNSDSSSYRREDESRSETPIRPRGLRDVYDKVAANSGTASNPTPKRVAPGEGSGDVTSPTKATDRLRALRDAKRSAFSSSTRQIEYEEEAPSPQAETAREGRQKRRIGLPSGPRAF